MKIWMIVLIAVAVFILLTFIVYSIIFFNILRRKDDKIFDEKDLSGTHYGPYVQPLYAAIKRMRGESYEEVYITAHDGKKLYGRYFKRGASKTAIMVHGYRSSPYNNFSVIGSDLLDKGYNVLFIYQRAHGKSGGSLIRMGQVEQKDVLRWIDKVAEDDTVKDILVYGTSMGAATVGYMSDKVTCPKVKCLVLDCGFTSFYEMICFIIKPAVAKILCPGLPIFVMWGAIFGVHFFKPVSDSVKGDKLPIVFIHGEKDTGVPVEHTLKNFLVCTAPKTLITVPDAGHTASMLVGGEEARERFYSFVNEYIK